MLLRPWSLLVIARRYALCVLITAQDVHLFCWHSCAEAKIEHNPLANHFPSGLMAARWLVSFALVFAMPDIAEPVDSWTSSVLNNRARHRYPCVIVSCVAKCPCRTARAHSRRYLINRCWPPRAVLSSVNLNHSGDVEHCPDTLCSDDSGRSELEMMSNFVAQAINSTERRQRGTWLTHSSTLARRTHDDETLDFQFPMLNALFAVCFDIRVWFICKTDLWTGDHMFTRTKLAWVDRVLTSWVASSLSAYSSFTMSESFSVDLQGNNRYPLCKGRITFLFLIVTCLRRSNYFEVLLKFFLLNKLISTCTESLRVQWTTPFYSDRDNDSCLFKLVIRVNLGVQSTVWFGHHSHGEACPDCARVGQYVCLQAYTIQCSCSSLN